MSADCLTMRVMAKKKEKTDDRPTVTVSGRVPAALADALAAYIDSQRPAPGVTETLKTALEDFLEAKGFWPPSN